MPMIRRWSAAAGGGPPRPPSSWAGVELRTRRAVQFDAKQSIGKRYARMDEAGTPNCFTVDGQTLEDQTVTVRDRDTLSQDRIGIDNVAAFLAEKIGG